MPLRYNNDKPENPSNDGRFEGLSHLEFAMRFTKGEHAFIICTHDHYDPGTRGHSEFRGKSKSPGCHPGKAGPVLTAK